ncbi:MAG: arginine--tRNA ligase [Pyrinomonadaceae bacterium]
MNLIELQSELREQVRAAARELFAVELETISGEVPPRTELGDLAFPVSFELAKRIKQATGEKRNPRAIAAQMQAKLEAHPYVARIEVAGAGYLNVFYDRARLLADLAAPAAKAGDQVGPKRMVEHTSINPNKAAHIGHVRNSVIGDTFVRILRAKGDRVEVQNYIDNTGVQVADVVVAFIHLENLDLDQIKALDQNLPANRSFDYYCWDLYTRVGLWYRDDDANGEPNKEKLALRAEVLHAVEAGNNATAELADYVATRNVECILDTMERLGIRYDLLPRESEILHLHFWDRAFERMKDTGALVLQTEGKSAGCWVMPFESHTGTDEHEADKIIVRSNGTVTYTGKDIAYQLWKLGRLGLDFNYRPFRAYPDGQETWITSPDTQTVEHPAFGGGTTVYNVIDVRQSYPQTIVRAGVAAVVPELGAEASVHLSYEMVALSPAAAEELGFALTDEDRKRPFIEMSGRKGLGVKADDLIDRLEASALTEVQSRHPELTLDQQSETARLIAVGALRYFLLKFTRNTLIVFDFKEALAFEGETGPYCQYAAVRANSIFRKLDEAAVASAAALIAAQPAELTAVFAAEGGDDLWSVATLAARLDETIAQAAEQTEPALLAKYTFALAKSFNLFYHRYKIIAEEDPARRAILVTVADLTRQALTRALATLGIQVPERM